VQGSVERRLRERHETVADAGIPGRAGQPAGAPGDPIGAHKMRVYIDGQLVREFTFDIEKGPDDQRGIRRGPNRSDPKSTT